jgi:hypothetical protein
MKLLDYFTAIRENFENIKNIETFTVDSVFTYSGDLSSTENQKKEFEARWPETKKDVKENPKFPPTLSTKDYSETKNDDCSSDLFDVRCNRGLKVGIWIIIVLTIIFTIIFIWYILKQLFSTSQITEQSLRPEPKEVTIMKPSVEAVPAKSFFGRLFGSNEKDTDIIQTPNTMNRTEAPNTMNRTEAPSTMNRTEAPSTMNRTEAPSTMNRTEVANTEMRVDVENRDNFIARLFSNRPMPERKEKVGFLKRFFGSGKKRNKRNQRR